MRTIDTNSNSDVYFHSSLGNARIAAFETLSGGALILDFKSVGSGIGATLTDTLNSKGFDYGADYGDNADARTILDKENVEERTPLYTSRFNDSTSTTVSNNASHYLKIYTPYKKNVSTLRFQVLDSTTTNTLSARIYDSAGTLITNGEGSISPSVLAGLHYIDITLTDTIALTAGSYYWVGYHQATGAGLTFPVQASLSNTDLSRIESASALGATVPTGLGSSNLRANIQLL